MHSHSISNVPAIGLAAVIFVVIIVDVHRDIRRLVRGRSIVLMSIIGWFLVEAIQLPFQVQRYSQAAYNYGVVCIALAFVAFLVGYHGSRSGCKLFDAPARRIRGIEDPELLWLMVLIGAVIGFAPIAYYSGLQITQLFHDIMGMRKTWGGVIARSQYGDSRSALLMLEMFIRGVGPFAVLLLLNREVSSRRRLICAFIALWPILRAFGSGTRESVITSMLPVLAVVFWMSRPKVQRGLVWTGIVSIPFVYLLMAAMVTSRESGTFSWDRAKSAEYVGHEMFRELLYITQKVPHDVDYQMGDSYYVQMINPIPRFLWKDKPKISSPVLMSLLHGWVHPVTGEINLTTHPGLIGEMYLNFGIPGIAILSLFGGWMIRGWDRILKNHYQSTVTMVFYSAGMAVVMVMGRSFSASHFYKMIAFVGLAYLVPYLGTHVQSYSRVKRRDRKIFSGVVPLPPVAK